MFYHYEACLKLVLVPKLSAEAENQTDIERVKQTSFTDIAEDLYV